MKKQFVVFLIRWVLNAVGIWIAIRLFGNQAGLGVTFEEPTLGTYLFAGFMVSVINSVIRPIIVILSLPAIVLTLGLFTLVINGLMVYLTVLIVPTLHLSFTDSILAGIILSLVNYIVGGTLSVLERRKI